MIDLLHYPAAIIAALLIRRYVLSFARIKGTSMLPTLKNGDWAFVWRLPYLWRHPRRGEVVICHFPGRKLKRLPFLKQLFVKRVMGLPGETIEIIEGTLHVDGTPLSEPYLDPARTRFFRTRLPVTLQENQYYVLGDNRDSSNDSRRVGPLKCRAIRGRVICVVWPPRRMGRVR